MATNTLVSRENLLLAAKMSNNNEIINVAEVLNEVNDPIQDAHVERSTDMTTHVVARRTALPAPTWVKVGNGWQPTVGTLNQVREEIGQLKSRYQCPEDVMKLQPNPAKFRSQQERAHVEGIAQEFANTLIGNFTTGVAQPSPPEEFCGFSYRYNTLATSNSAYVLSNGNTTGTDSTSIWFVQWGPGKVYLIYPRNGMGGGIKKQDKGLQLTNGDNSQELWAYITEFAWDIGLCIEDTRCVKRLCNIDSVLTETKTLNEDYIIQIRNNFQTPGTISMYCNETVFTQLQILAKDKTNVHWTENNPFGKPILYFLDMPVRRCDGISDDEAIVTT